MFTLSKNSSESAKNATGHSSEQRGQKAALVFADGTVFYGRSIGTSGPIVGELCFNTGLTGYQETLSDPSYAGQIITFTFPHIGNVGVNDEDKESNHPAAKGLVIREDITSPSNFRATSSLQEYLKKHKIAGIAAVDTRAIVQHLRKNGPQNAAIGHADSASGEVDIAELKALAASCPSLKGMELAKTVTSASSKTWNEGSWTLGHGHTTLKEGSRHVVAVDFGAKQHILRSLVDVGCRVTVVPATSSAEDILKLSPDGVFLSNGPGDPAATGLYAVPMIQKLLEKRIPIFGICLGHQLLAHALGCITEKMEQGHRGSNQPVKDLTTSKVEITSQNHGFRVVKEQLPSDVHVTHTSLFDGTIEGICSTRYPAFSVQYHPESSPGPHDSRYLFVRFVQLMHAA